MAGEPDPAAVAPLVPAAAPADAGPAAAAPVAGLAPVAAEVAAPASVAAVEAPAVVETPAPEAAAAAEAAAPPSEAPVEAKAPERPKTLLEKADEEKAAAAKAKEEAAKKPEDAAKPEEPAKPAEPEPAGEPPLTFELPKELKAAPEQLAEFTDLIRGAKTGDLKDVGQKLLSMHTQVMEAYAKQYAQEVSDNQWKVWNELIAKKDNEILADPILGGAGHETAKAAVIRMRDLLVPEERRESFATFMNVTGAGSWPDFWHLLHRAAEIFDEPPMPPPGGKPPRDAHLPQTGARFGLLHDHPSSQQAGARS
jgi:hypothetical protein